MFQGQGRWLPIQEEGARNWRKSTSYASKVRLSDRGDQKTIKLRIDLQWNAVS